MNELEDGVLLRSNSETYALAGTINFKTDFLAPARRMAAPEVAFLMIRLTGTVNSAAGTDASGFDAAKLVSRFKFSDLGGEVVNASGQTLRLNEMIELGEKQTDMLTLAAAAADSARTWQIVIPFHLFKSERARDTRVPLEHFLEGGQLELTTPAALPTGWDGFTGSVRLYAYVVDGRRREVKSRLVIREEVMALQEAYYNVNGSLRTLVGTSTLTTTSASSWAAFTALNSTTLGYPAGLESDMLQERYRLNTETIHASDPILATTPLALAFVTPDRAQKIGAMIDCRQVHLDLGASPPTNARLLIVAIKDRDPALASLVAGYASIPDYQAALEKGGTVVSAKGKDVSVREFAATLVRRLPARIGGMT